MVAKDDPNADRYFLRPINRDVGSARAFSWANAQLKECTVSHEACEPYFDSGTALLPTRLLSLNDQSAAYPAKLYTSNLGEMGAYVVLSYCWGGLQSHSATTNNIDQYSNGITACNIPRTILDAIVVTRKLGFRLLWVDSLCILQDSPTDIEREVSQMARIYKNATITIMAASARSCYEGFLQDRTEKTARDRVTRCIIPLGDGRDGFAKEMELVVNAPAHLGIDNEPLNQRGWALQEILLSSRKLYYGEEKLIWACQTTACSDGGDLLSADRAIPLKSRSKDRNPGYCPLSKREELPSSWASDVEQYSKRSLTFAEDTLPAIAGIAAELQAMTGWKYLAGLWQERIIHGLPWERLESSTHSRSNTNRWRAPSWSWASLDNPVRHLKTNFDNRIFAELVSCAAEPLHSENPLGQVRTAELVLRGPLCAISFSKGGKLIPDGFDPKMKLTEGLLSYSSWTIDREEPIYALYPQDVQRKFVRGKSNRKLSQLLESNWRPQGDTPRSKRPIAWCLALFVGHLGLNEFPVGDVATIGLVLMRVKGDCYQRIGLFVGPKEDDDRYSPSNYDCYYKSAPVTTVKIV
ncbi:hypothetical protein LTR56_009030 [Elasticomyces elasticus]|nr:hypothetical protein LTR56_009030 [Elasticomyces elasticus]KAK3663831.1 hypothetical protein LTR22_005292 [Elasticomyces elasticus]KAK4923960.1 hypothetical protein LTR49_008905 [Elasticomyces elasticus]KAK5762163.1 hypothetical protein LTS12_007684 [Elasticomyces elasticus]